MVDRPLDFNSVLAAFKAYLAKDDCVEVVKTSRGYAFIQWDNCLENWIEIQHCATADILQSILLGSLDSFLEYGYTGDGTKLSDAEITEIKKCKEI